ncbi:MAG TPA: S41 family peptidase [Allosphingosinicella sp.]
MPLETPVIHHAFTSYPDNYKCLHNGLDGRRWERTGVETDIKIGPRRALTKAFIRGGLSPLEAEKVLQPAEVVAEIRRLIAESYVLPERRAELDAALSQEMSSGRYDVDQPALLAERVNADLERVGRDRHLNFRYNPKRVARMTATIAGSTSDHTAFEREVRCRNHGVHELKLLCGNVRCLNLGSFDWIGEDSEAVLEAAMHFLRGGDAVIIDLRRNGGGSPRAVHQVISHFMEAGRPLVTFYRGNDVSPTFATLPGLSTMVGKPLYVLTSEVTGSAAEEFVGHIAGYGLGEVVGARTSGGAFMNDVFPIAGQFELSLSVARPVLASTGGDWERVGIAPTITTSAAALETAHVHALRRLAAATSDPAKRNKLEALAAEVSRTASLEPSPLPDHRS